VSLQPSIYIILFINDSFLLISFLYVYNWATVVLSYLVMYILLFLYGLIACHCYVLGDLI
jgi:hypothetical protein